jgi:xanthine permease XanP
VLAVGTVLQALPKGPVGSGFLAPAVMTAVYVGPSLEAVRLGGLALMGGMTLYGGIVEAALSRSLRRLRTLFPPELAGVVIFLVGASNGMVGVRYLVARGAGAALELNHWEVVATVFLVMIGLNIWGKGILRSSCALFGMIGGYAVALAVGLMPLATFDELRALPAVLAPRVDYFGLSFNAALILPFTIAALANTLKAGALITACERINDADWVQPNMRRIAGGVLADGITTAFSGALSVFGVNVSASSVGLSEATGVASRQVAYAIAGIFVVLAFIPAIPRFLTVMPAAVLGATLFFTSCAILKNGIETIASRMLDTRRTLMVGMALLSGFAVEAFPDFFSLAPAAIRPLVDSSLVFGTLVGFLLNLAFRFGIRRHQRLEIDPAAIDLDRVHSFVENAGARWGARRDVITRASFALQQGVETIAEECRPGRPLRLEIGYDEFTLDAEVRYAGALLEMPEHRPSAEEILASEAGARRLAGYLLRRNADRVAAVLLGDLCVVHFHFE